MSNAYRDEALRVARIAFSSWNRDPASPSFGCFDRAYWGWKKKDLPDATFQAAVTLVLRLAEAEGRVGSLDGMLEGYVAFMERIQHKDGSFDQVYPNERAPGVVYDILSALTWLWRSPNTDDLLKRRLETIMARAVDYALSADEKHGEIANHFAQYGCELLLYGSAFDNDKAVARGNEYVERTLRLFHASEGWFREYDGPDTGYQTRALAFLARAADRTGDGQLWDTIKRGGRFVESCLMPDNSVHPMLGVRSTALVYVSAFERLANRFPDFRPLAERVHSSWQEQAAPMPSLLDFENGIRLAEDAFDASDIREARDTGGTASDESQSSSDVVGDLRDAGLHRRSLPIQGGTRTVHIGARLGGVVAVFDTDEKRPGRLRHEDAGYLLAFADGSRWVMRHAGSGETELVSETTIRVAARFARALHEELTPFKLIVLRVLNLTVLRSQWIGDLFRKIVVRRLISGQDHLPLTCSRTIYMEAGRITVRDRFAGADGLRAKLDGARLFRCRRTIANHMASSRYFQQQELDCDQPWMEELPVEVLDGRVVEYSID